MLPRAIPALALALAPALLLGGRSAEAAPNPPPPPPDKADLPAPPTEAPTGAPPAEGAPAEREAPARTAPRGVTPPPPEMVRENTQLLERARAAREAAGSGHCTMAKKHLAEVRELDETFHDTILARDPAIIACVDPESIPRYELVKQEVRADPPASAGRILGEILLGAVTGGGGAIVGALLGGGLCIGGGDDNGEGSGCGPSAIGGAYAGAILTIPFGVRAAGASGNQTGSLGATFLGALAGGAGGLLMLANGRDDVTAMGLILAPTLGAVIGFNSSRRYKPRTVRVRVNVSGALVDWNDGEPVVSVPLVTRSKREERSVTSVPIFGGSF